MGAFLLNNPKCIFIHIPKTAGFTIRNGIFKGDYEGPIFQELPKDWESYFSFTFVRNPFDRLVSAWKMFANGMENSIWLYKNEPPLKDISFLNFLKTATDSSIDHHSRSDIYSVLRHHTLPQVHHYHCFQYADFIGKFENLEEDFEIVANKVGLKNYDIAHLNKTNRRPYKEYYNDETYNLVRTHYSEDLDMFGYKF